jgi:hypothetical protein
MPPAQRTHRSNSPTPADHDLIAFLDFFRQLTLEERIALVKSFRPTWTVVQIACTCAVSERTILRSPSYRRLRAIDLAKPAQSKWRGRTHRRIDPRADERGFYDPDR